ncbi:LysE family translocator [Marinomonas epiphytica]
MDLSSWLSLLVVCVLGAISPGPSLAVILRVSISRSPLHGACAAVAHGLGIGFWALLSLQGLAILIAEYEQAFHVLTQLGGLYLAWLGFKAIRFAGNSADINTQAAQSSLLTSAKEGLLVALFNPKAALFFLALFSQFITEHMTSLVKWQFWSTVVVVDTSWYLLVALLLVSGPVLPWLRRHSLWVDRGMGSLLILLGVRIILI